MVVGISFYSVTTAARSFHKASNERKPPLLRHLDRHGRPKHPSSAAFNGGEGFAFIKQAWHW